MEKIKDIIDYLNSWAPPQYAESYDNVGLLVGDCNMKLSGVLISLDCTEAIVNEAIQLGCNLIISHHPILFRGIKKLTGSSYVERTVVKAIKHDVALFAIHTNLDNLYSGVNGRLATILGLENIEILLPKKDILEKLVFYVPEKNVDEVMAAVFSAGAGELGHYSECSFISQGTGSFKASSLANPTVGKIEQRHYEAEKRVEVILPSHLHSRVIANLVKAHPYEEVAYDIFQLANENQNVGSGMIGDLKKAMDTKGFIAHLRECLRVNTIRHTADIGKAIRRVAMCGGSGSSLLPTAQSKGADLYISADFKYHEFFDADGKIVIVDIGHYESELHTIELIADVIQEKFTTFAVHLTKVNTNPIIYS